MSFTSQQVAIIGGTITNVEITGLPAPVNPSDAATKNYVDTATSSAKAWVYFTVSGGVATIQDSYNVTSVTRVGAGAFTIVFTTPFASANYVSIGYMESHSLNMASSGDPATKTASQCRIFGTNAVGGGQVDPDAAQLVCFGKQ